MIIKDNENKSSERFCSVAKKCNACQLSNMTYQEQLRWKSKQVKILLDKFHKVNEIIGMESPYNYRNKVQAAFKYDFRRKQVLSGIYQSKTGGIIPIKFCLTEDKKADEIINTVTKLIDSFGLLPYDERSGRGIFRHILVKRGFFTNEIMVVLVTATPIFPSKNNFVSALIEKHKEITTIIQSVNKSAENLVLGDNEKILYGKGTIEDVLCGCKFRISAKSFYQINPIQTEILYSKAIKMAQLSGSETVIDAYCGIGTIGIIASKAAKSVIGIELNKDAIKDAIVNAKLNNISNIAFHIMDASEAMSQMADEGVKIDVVFMDPPRAGSDTKFLSALTKLSPKRVVYISCNPQTQERDLSFLTKHGYAVREIQPVDMFPHTNHVESVVALSRVKSKE